MQLKAEHRFMLQGVGLALMLALIVIGLLAFAHAWAPHKEHRCFETIALSQFPKWLGCTFTAHEGLAGGLIGAAGTIFAGWLAFMSVMRQIRQQRDDRAIAHEEAKTAAVFALLYPMAAAKVLVRAVAAAGRAATPGTKAAADEAIGHQINRLEAALNNFVLRDISRELGAADRATFISLVSNLGAFVYFGKSADLIRENRIIAISSATESFKTLLEAFDQGLFEEFTRADL